MSGNLVENFEAELNVFHEAPLPENAKLAGYSALIAAFDLEAPAPEKLSATLSTNSKREVPGWFLYSISQAPAATVSGHLTFALRYEGVELLILSKLFEAIGPGQIEEMVRASPTGQYARRAWFFYEWLIGEQLDLPDTGAVPYTLALDPDQQIPGTSENSPRHKVRDNLPGTRAFCPIVRRTEAIDRYLARNLSEQAADAVARIPRDVIARAAAFLLLKDSRSSYAIEGETPPQDRMQRWGRAIGEAGRNPLSHDELRRLQRMVIGDQRFLKLGYRTEGGFVGEHDRQTHAPIPDHISARHDDIMSLMDGLIHFVGADAEELDPVIAAAVAAFGFVYIHPFEDGNGRVHRYLVHHVLAKGGFNPPGVVFPVSSAIESRIDQYRRVLETHSRAILPFIEWRATDDYNVDVQNQTADYYCFFDATPHAEFLFECVEQTIETDLPNEADYLRRYDQFRAEVMNIVDMPDRTLDLLFRFLQQNNGVLSNRAQQNEFELLEPAEIQQIEHAYGQIF